MTVHKNGFTITELIIVLAVMVILAAIAVPIYINVLNEAKYEADYASISVLNYATQVYECANDLQGTDIFAGIGDNEDRMQILVDDNYLLEMVHPQQENAEFRWIVSDQAWIVYGGMEVD